ncbi:transposase, partial [uncultured Microscilla sp.]|uniref:transposase n=1 Tax=uncultured Microscilla sp. TaxID=432653 RepID=UPI00260D5DAB
MENGLENLPKEMLIALLKAEREQAKIAIEKQQITAKEHQVVVKKHQVIQQDVERIKLEKAQLLLEKSYLEAQITEYKRLLHGQKRERFIANPEQLSLPFETPAEVKEIQQRTLTEQKEATKTKQKRKHPGRAKLPEHLPVEEIE